LLTRAAPKRDLRLRNAITRLKKAIARLRNATTYLQTVLSRARKQAVWLNAESCFN